MPPFGRDYSRAAGRRQLLVDPVRGSGWDVYAQDGKPAFIYNWLDMEKHTVAADDEHPPGEAGVEVRFAYDRDGGGKGGDVALYVDGSQLAGGRGEKTQPNIFSADETADVGLDNQTPVVESLGYGGSANHFTGKIDKVAGLA